MIKERMDEDFRMARMELGLKQGEMADRLGVSQQTVSRYEHGEKVPEADVFIKLLKMYNKNLSRYFEEDSGIVDKLGIVEEDGVCYVTYEDGKTDWNELVKPFPKEVRAGLENFLRELAKSLEDSHK